MGKFNVVIYFESSTTDETTKNQEIDLAALIMSSDYIYIYIYICVEVSYSLK
jgi:hypothetical protein